MGFLNPDGVLYLWEKAKSHFAPQNAVSDTENGLMTSADKVKLDGIATGANKYVHPAYTPKESGLYKITVDGTGHVSAVEMVVKADITGLGIPEADTTYEVFGSNKDGLVPGCAPNQMTNTLYLTNHGTWTGIDRLSGFTLDELSDTVYTGIMYLITVVLLVLPYLLLPAGSYAAALVSMLVIVALIILVFNYYIAVAKSLSFRKRFLEMFLISGSVAVLSFAVGLLVKAWLGIDI